MNVLKRELMEVTKVECKVCNKCGKEIDITSNDYFEGKVQWGYFSNKDGEIHQFDLCEDCYDNLVKNFKILPKIEFYL